jgi:hypothetical protein
MVGAARVLAEKARNGVLTPSSILIIESAEPSTTTLPAKRYIAFENESRMDLATKTHLASRRWGDIASTGPSLPIRDLPLEHVDRPDSSFFKAPHSTQSCNMRARLFRPGAAVCRRLPSLLT